MRSVLVAAVMLMPALVVAQAGRVGYLQVLCSERDAKAAVDGRPVGKTPLRRKALPPGTHHLLVSRLGFMAFEQPVEIQSGETTEIIVDLLPVSGVVHIESYRSARVFVDDRLVGTSPVEIEVTPGPHRIRVEASGYRSYEEQLDLAAGEWHELAPRLTPLPQDELLELPLELPQEPFGLPKKEVKAEPDDLPLLPLELLQEPTPRAPPGAIPATVSAMAGPEQPWYRRWWALGAGAALISGAAAVMAVAFSGHPDGVDLVCEFGTETSCY